MDSNIETFTITVNPVNDAPVATIFGSAPIFAVENEIIAFLGGGSDVENGANVTFDWNWGDESMPSTNPLIDNHSVYKFHERTSPTEMLKTIIKGLESLEVESNDSL